ncbi:unnamed protein product [Clavelina lepadiformis]|uniref:Abhydrolase domain-containing protein 16A n=1 Tax=Clavelina lepadiformis TaxID=159417 RepID=A0ABP0F2I0_CLALP
MATFWRCLTGPFLRRIHKSRDGNHRAYEYEPNGIEETTQKILSFVNTTKSILLYASPLWASFLYRRGYCTLAYFLEFGKLACWPVLMLFGVYFIRGYGRSKNQEYIDFLDILHGVIKSPKDSYRRRLLRTYDFDFRYWPVDFQTDQVEVKKTKNKSHSTWGRLRAQNSNFLSTIFIGFPKDFLAYFISHCVGVWLVYPGSTSLMQAAIGLALDDARNKLVEEHTGLRAKLLAEDKNEIDCMFVDRRQKDHPHRLDSDVGPEVTTLHSDTLVICCEGNAGFYEVGCMCTPLSAGYSVLGWNHPGFAGSSGKPFPDAENNALDVVMQYAIHKLNFKPENIILFAWSIGAYTAINAAASYPDIRGLFLDATFYDIMPFARRMMPNFIEPLVEYTIRNYLNLHNSKNLDEYNGPVAFIRRMDDEVMNLEGPKRYSSNLGNLLLEEFLRHRFPNLFEKKKNPDVQGEGPQSEALWEWLLAPSDQVREAVLNKWAIRSTECTSFVKSVFSLQSSIPSSVGERFKSYEKTQLVLYLADKHMQHYSSTHCSPLPSSWFAPPWGVLASCGNGSDSDNGSDFEVIQHSPNL